MSLPRLVKRKKESEKTTLNGANSYLFMCRLEQFSVTTLGFFFSSHQTKKAARTVFHSFYMQKQRKRDF